VINIAINNIPHCNIYYKKKIGDVCDLYVTSDNLAILNLNMHLKKKQLHKITFNDRNYPQCLESICL